MRPAPRCRLDPKDITVYCDDGARKIAAEHEDERRSERRTYHKRSRFPREVDDEEITTESNIGILEVRLLMITGRAARDTEIEVAA